MHLYQAELKMIKITAPTLKERRKKRKASQSQDAMEVDEAPARSELTPDR